MRIPERFATWAVRASTSPRPFSSAAAWTATAAGTTGTPTAPRVTEDSTRVAFVLETLHATRDGDLLRTAADELRNLLTPHAGHAAVRYLGAERPRTTT